MGGWVGPYMMGWVKTNTGSFDLGYFLMAAFMFLAGLTVLTLKYGLGMKKKTAPDKAALAEEN